MLSRILWRRILLVFLCLLFLAQFIRVLFLEVEYYDGYDNFHNAQVLIGDSSAWFYRFRAPLPYILLVPVMLLREVGILSDPLLGPHVYQWMLGVLAALLTIPCFKALKLSPLGSYLGTLTLFLSPLIAHYLPFAVPTTSVLLLTPLTILFLMRSHERPSYPLAMVTGLVLGLATLARFQMAFFGPGVALFWLFNRPENIGFKRSLGLLITMGASALFIWNGFFALAQYMAGDPRNPLFAGFQICLEYRSISANFISDFPMSLTFYFEVFFLNFGVVGTLLAVLGLGFALRRRSPADMAMLCCLLTFLAGQIFIANIEARYSLVMSFFYVYFIVLGFDQCLAWFVKPHWSALVLVLCLVSSLSASWSELSQWGDAFYQRNFGETMVKRVDELEQEFGDFSIYWKGPFHAEFAPIEPLHDYDPYQHVYHFGHKALIYHSPSTRREFIFAGTKGMAQAMAGGATLVIETQSPRPTNFSRPEKSHPIRWTLIKRFSAERSKRYKVDRVGDRVLLTGGEGERKLVWGPLLGQSLIWPKGQESIELPVAVSKISIYEYHRGTWTQ